MKLHTKLLKAELSAVNRISDICPLEKSRIFMNKIGKLYRFAMAAAQTMRMLIPKYFMLNLLLRMIKKARE